MSAAPSAAAVSRRSLVLGGAGLAALGGGVGAWQLGLFLPNGSGTKVAIAVLGFENLSGDEDQIWFSDGLSNELRQVLARNPLLQVSAPTSSAALGGEDDFALGRALGVPFNPAWQCSAKSRYSPHQRRA